MSSSWRGGSTRAHRKARRIVLARDRHRCRLALQGEWVNSRGETVRCLGAADSAHHTLGKAVTGDDPRYMVASCKPCNLKVGDPAKHDPPARPMTRW